MAFFAPRSDATRNPAATRRLYEQSLLRARIELGNAEEAQKEAEENLRLREQEWKAVEFDADSPQKTNTAARLQRASRVLEKVKELKEVAKGKVEQRRAEIKDFEKFQEERQGYHFAEGQGPEEEDKELDSEVNWEMVDVRRDIFVDFTTVKENEPTNSESASPKR